MCRMEFLIKKEQTYSWAYVLTIRMRDGKVRDIPLFLVLINW